MSFEKSILKNGEGRADYIRKRFAEGAGRKQIHKEINAPELYSGPEGKQWNIAIVDGLKPKAIDTEKLYGEKHPAKPVVVAEEIPSSDSLLTDAEKAEIRQQALDDVIAEKRRDAKKTLLEQEKARLSGRSGLKTGDPQKDELVTIEINIPEFCPYLWINMPHGQKYFHGTRYQVPRHVAKQLDEMQARAWDHEREIQGQKKRDYRKRSPVIVGGESTGAPPMVVNGGVTV
jgi:hypothetical protein